MKEIKSWIEKSKNTAIKFLKSNVVNIYAHVIIKKEDNLFTAHCLEFDIVADGKTAEEAKKNIVTAIVNHISFCVEYNNIDKILNPAPQEYWNEFYFNSKRENSIYEFPNYVSEDTELPFLNNIIKKVEFGSSFANA